MLKWAKTLICKHVDACFSIQLQMIMFYAFVVLCVCALEPYPTLICGASWKLPVQRRDFIFKNCTVLLLPGTPHPHSRPFKGKIVMLWNDVLECDLLCFGGLLTLVLITLAGLITFRLLLENILEKTQQQEQQKKIAQKTNKKPPNVPLTHILHSFVKT